ncbi:MAG: hypothetical protein HY873_11595 [Chloroflexi bacterium]|nr:hypothetical protein [Chloroflexota bacterium]
MPAILRAAAVTLSLLLLPAAFVACNSKGELSLEDYFAELEKLDSTQSEAQDKLDGEYEDRLNPSEFSEDVSKDFQDYFRASRDAAQAFADDLKDLEAPDEAADAHDEAVAAFGDCLDRTGDVINDIGDAESFEELGAIFEDESIAEACDKTTAACETLQGIADENDVDVSLDCGE